MLSTWIHSRRDAERHLAVSHYILSADIGSYLYPVYLRRTELPDKAHGDSRAATRWLAMYSTVKVKANSIYLGVTESGTIP
jgi:hypothetical protein